MDLADAESSRKEPPTQRELENEKVLFCDICQHYKDYVKASMWCSECLELYCSPCYKTHSRSRSGIGHRTESIDKYLEKHEFITNISTSCQKHSKRLNMYCSIHDLPICYNCHENHENCTLEYLPKLVKDEMSEKFENVKKRTNNILEQIAVLMSTVEKENSSITKKRDDFVNSVNACVIEILKKTDMIKENGLRDLESHCNKMLSIKNQLKVIWISICRIKQQLTKLTLHDSESHAFVSFLAMHQDLQKYECQIKKTLDDNQIQIINPTINFPCDEVTYERNVRPFPPNRESSPTSFSQQTNNLRLQDYEMFDIPKGKFTNNITGSSFLSNDCICFSDSHNNRLILKSVDGTYETCDLPFSPVGVASISNSKVAISFKSSIGIVDVKDKNMENFKFKHSDRFGCIACKEEKLIVHVCGYGFYIVSVQGEKIRELKITGSLSSSFSCMNNEIYCTYQNESLLCCFNLQSGLLSGTQPSSKLAKPPAGIACDQNGIIFVVCENNIVTISTYDMNYKGLIKRIKRMKKPSAIAYGSENKRLLVCSEIGKVIVYSIKNEEEQT